MSQYPQGLILIIPTERNHITYEVITTAILRLHFSLGGFSRRADAGTKEVGRKIDIIAYLECRAPSHTLIHLLFRRRHNIDRVW